MALIFRQRTKPRFRYGNFMPGTMRQVYLLSQKVGIVQAFAPISWRESQNEEYAFLDNVCDEWHVVGAMLRVGA